MVGGRFGDVQGQSGAAFATCVELLLNAISEHQCCCLSEQPTNHWRRPN
jgi:hypothetical protein